MIRRRETMKSTINWAMYLMVLLCMMRVVSLETRVSNETLVHVNIYIYHRLGKYQYQSPTFGRQQFVQTLM